MTDLEGAAPPGRDDPTDWIRELVQRSRSGESGESSELDSLPRPAQLQVKDHEQDIKLKKKYANWLLCAVIAQLVVANVVFIAYAWAGKDWDLDAVVIDVWLVATLVQVIGVVAIVTRYLFPRRDLGLDADA